MIRYILLFMSLCCLLRLESNEVVFIVTGDLHGRLADLAALAPVISKYPRAVKVDLGDMVQGNYAMVRADGLPVIRAFNILGYDLLIPGNHDLEFSLPVLQMWQREFRGEILAAQWQLAGIDLPGYKVIERDGCRIGVIGLGDVGLKKLAGYWKELTYTDVVSAVRMIVPELQKAGCDAIVLLCHISVSNYLTINRLLYEVPEIDAVAGAHSHREEPGRVINGVLAVQPGAYGQSAVKLTLVFDEKRKFLYASSQLLRPGKNKDDRIMALLREAERAARKEGGELLAVFPDRQQFGEAAAEMIRRAAGADMAVFSFNAGRFSRDITRKKLFEMLPYGNRIAVISMSPDDVVLLQEKFSGRPGYFFSGRPGYFFSGRPTGKMVKVAMSDFLLTRIPELGKNAVVLPVFERLELERVLKTGKIR